MWAKRYPGTLLLQLAIPILFSAGCGDDALRDRAQFQTLELALDAIDVENDPHWIHRLEDAEGVVIDNPEILSVKRMCVSAYREYANAMTEMAAAQTQLKSLEAAVAAGKADGLAENYARTKDAILQTDNHLNQSRVMIRKCTLDRNELKVRLKLVRN